MTVLQVLEFPDARLRIKAKPVEQINDEIKTIATNMIETMYSQKGIGLAAIQVNIPYRIIVIDISEEHNQPVVLINPIITKREGIQYESEGCLSFPGIYDKVERSNQICVKAYDLENKEQEFTAEGLLAVCIQHEIDHLDGILFIDHLSRLKKDRARKRLEKNRRREYS